MQVMKKLSVLLSVSFVAVLLVSSIGIAQRPMKTALNSAWKDGGYEGFPLASVMIVGRAEKVETRKLFEDTFVALLEEKGVKAVSSLAAMSGDADLDKDTVKAKAIELGMTTVLVTSVASTDSEDEYKYGLTPKELNNFSAYYAHIHGQIPPTNRTYVFLENKLYDVATEDLVWAGRSTTIDPNSINDLIKDLGKAVVEEFKIQGLLK